MKKIFGLISTMLCLMAGITSCLDDSNAEATCTYAVVSDSIVYTDTLDAVYDSLIHVSLTTLEYANYTFQKSAEVDQSITAYAVAKCDELAGTEFAANLSKTVTLSAIQNEMYKANSDFFTAKGITNAAGIGLHPFTVYLTLWNYSNQVAIGIGHINVSE